MLDQCPWFSSQFTSSCLTKPQVERVACAVLGLEDDAVMLGTSGLASPSAPRDQQLSVMCHPPGGRILAWKRSWIRLAPA